MPITGRRMPTRFLAAWICSQVTHSSPVTRSLEHAHAGASSPALPYCSSSAPTTVAGSVTPRAMSDKQEGQGTCSCSQAFGLRTRLSICAFHHSTPPLDATSSGRASTWPSHFYVKNSLVEYPALEYHNSVNSFPEILGGGTNPLPICSDAVPLRQQRCYGRRGSNNACQRASSRRKHPLGSSARIRSINRRSDAINQAGEAAAR